MRRALEVRLGHVSHLVSEFAASGEAYLRAAAAAEAAHDRSVDHARAAYSFAWAHDYERARGAIDDALAIRGEGVAAGAAMALAERGFLHGVEGDLGRFEELLERGVGSPGPTARSLALTCLLEGELAEWRGDYRRALSRQAQAIELSRKHGLPEYLVPAVWFSGKALCCLGEYSRALETLEEGLAFSERLGNAAAQTRVLNTLGWLHGEVGSHVRAAEYNERSVVGARAMVQLALVPGAPELYGNASINLARNRIALGDVAAAADLLAEVREQVDGESDPWMLWRYRLHLVDAEGRLLLAQGDPDAARAAAERQLAGARGHGARKLEARALELLGRTQLALDRRSEAEATLRDAVALAEGIGYRPVCWRAAALEAELARREGDGDRAERGAAWVRASTEELAGSLAHPDLAGDLRGLGVRLAADPFRGVA